MQRPAAAPRPATPVPEPNPEGPSLASAFKMVLLFAGLLMKVPVGLYFPAKLLLFQGLLNMTPDDSGFYATIVAVAGLHVVLAVFVFVAWKESQLGFPPEKKDENKDENKDESKDESKDEGGDGDGDGDEDEEESKDE